MARLFVRTATGGTGADVELEDLGLIVPTSATWLELSSSFQGVPLEASGHFTSVELRDSRDLYDEITTSGLEWSKEGVSVYDPSEYTPNYMLIEDIYDDFWEADDVATKFDVLVDEAGDLTYVGEASPGTLTSAGLWRVFRMDESNVSEELVKRYANGDAGFVHVWETRSGLNYGS